MIKRALNRVEGWGRVDRTQEIDFSFDGQWMKGYRGDTLASALLSYDMHLVGRSFKYHRPRGFLGVGSEEPNGLVTWGEGKGLTPNTRGTMLELSEGLKVRSQNYWPSLHYDVKEGLGLFSGLLTAGFYYKTFIWGWRFYEPLIRRMAGLGEGPREVCERDYAWRYCSCDVLVIGGGSSGTAALSELLRGKGRVVILDEGHTEGGWMQGDEGEVEGMEGMDWVRSVWSEADSCDHVRVLRRTTAVSVYPGNYVLAVERSDEVGEGLGPREVLWKIRAKEVILASGGLEQPSTFVNNDRPGVMLAGAVRRYLRHYGVRVGERVCVVTNNDDAYQTALVMKEAGSEVMVLDSRYDVRGLFSDRAREEGIRIEEGSYPTRVRGRNRVRGLGWENLGQGGESLGGREVGYEEVDIVAMSHGFTPCVHLNCHWGGKLKFDEEREIFVPEESSGERFQVVGMAMGEEGFAGGMVSGREAGRRALSRLGMGLRGRMGMWKVGVGGREVEEGEGDRRWDRESVWFPNLWHKPGKQFVDFQNDVSVRDVLLAHAEGFESVEHMKRYTTLGMATDQGKTSNMHGLALLSKLCGKGAGFLGTTTYRPPFTPLTIGTVAGMHRGDVYHAVRTTSAHSAHVEMGAVFEGVGDWKRARYYTQTGESMDAAVRRESLGVREGVGVMDASTLGKIDIRGKDSVRLLNMLYTNDWSGLKEGGCRYGMMLDEAGMIMDDGVTARLGVDHYHMTTTTGGAARVLGWIEGWLQTEWPDWEVYCKSVTEVWSVYAVNGVHSLDVLRDILDDGSLAEGVSPMRVSEGKVGGVGVRIFGVNFTGGLGYEINIPSRYGLWLWRRILEAGEKYGIVPYGTETMHLLRAEVGYVIVGQDVDSTVTPYDADHDGLVSKKKEDFLGYRGLKFGGLRGSGRLELVGLESENSEEKLEEGGVILSEAADLSLLPLENEGHVTSSYMSPNVGRSIAMGLVKDGKSRYGEEVLVGRVGAGGEFETTKAKIVSRVWWREGGL